MRGTNDWAKVENVTKEPIPENAVKFTVAAFVHRGCTGYAAFDDISVTEYETKPLGGLFSSAYRDVAAEGEVKFFAPLFTPEKSFRASGWKVDFTYTAADGARKTVPANSIRWSLKRTATKRRNGWWSLLNAAVEAILSARMSFPPISKKRSLFWTKASIPAAVTTSGACALGKNLL